MSGCDELRGLLIDHVLGQSEGEEAARVAAHLAACEACRGEEAALRATFTLLRSGPRALPSPEFRDRLAQRLDAVERRERHVARRRSRTGAEASFTLFRLRLNRSPATRIKVAAALLPFALGGAWWLVHSARPAEPGDERVIVIPPPRDRPAPQLVDGPSDPGGPDRLKPPSIPKSPDPSEAPPNSILDQLVNDDASRIDRLPVPTPDDPQLAESGSTSASEVFRQRHDLVLPHKGGGGGEVTAPPVAAAPEATPVTRALDWLVRTQRSDGSWAPGDGEPGLDTGTTALALLAFVSENCLGVGDVAADPRERAAAAATRWLFSKQSSGDGAFVGGNDAAAHVFCHAVSTLALLDRHVRLTAAGRSATADLIGEHDRIERALARLEVDLERLVRPGSNDPALARCAGQNAAWASLTLTTARLCGDAFHLKPTGARLTDDVLQRLRNEQPELIVATTHAVDAMAARASSPNDEAWRRAVERVLDDPAAIEPSLRFLVASALATTRRGRADGGFADFERRMTRGLGAIQSPQAGYFDSGRRWDCFGGGAVYETALGVLSLSVAARADDFAAMRQRLGKLGAHARPK